MSSLADLPEVAGFFSYSRDDDDDSRGRLSALRDAIQRELSGQLGLSKTNFRLWQDQEAIAFGELWEAKIKEAIEQAVFFIPIVTPRAVNSRYCKFEFEAFLARENALSRTDLVFPIIYISVPALVSEAQWRNDPVLSIIGVRQYTDWRALRYLDIDTPAVREAVGRFCEKIAQALQKPWISPEEREKRLAEAARLAEEERRAKAARQAEEEKQRAEAARQAEEEKRRAEAVRQAEEEKRRAEAVRRAEEEKQQAAAARRAAAKQRRAEAARLKAEQPRRAEAARQAEGEQRRPEAAWQPEEDTRRAARGAEEEKQQAEEAPPAEEEQRAQITGLPEEEMLPLKTTQLTERPNHYTVIEAARAPEEKRRRAETARQRMSEIEIQRADAAQLAKELRRYAEAAQEVSKLFVGKKGAYVAPKIPW